MTKAAPDIAPARTADDVRVVTALFRAYASSLGIDLAYQNFAAELAEMPGKYAPPGGALLLARGTAGVVLGCVGVRPLGAEICEMKRLSVCPEGRGCGVGQGLVDAAIAAAARIGYRDMWLDTLPSMAAAQALYRKSGFAEIAPYYATPVAGTVFLGRRLACC